MLLSLISQLATNLHLIHFSKEEQNMLMKTVKIGDKEVTFKSSAAIPRLYRIKFKRDIFRDLTRLEKSYKDKDSGAKELEIADLEIFENVAYIMALHADPQH